MLYSRDNNLLFVDECSAKIGLGVTEIFQETIEEIYNQQMKLVEKGETTLEKLKLHDDDMALSFENHRCCY